jgi:hypothetical protein
MTKKNPDDSVREEQFGANENAAETEDTIQEVGTQETDPAADSEKPAEESVAESIEVNETEEDIIDPVPSVIAEKIDSEPSNDHSFDDIELPPVDYSGYTKHELIETLVLIIENRPPAEIRDDVERIKVFLFKKFKLEADERKNKYLAEGAQAASALSRE